jgi:hypothetical protein
MVHLGGGNGVFKKKDTVQVGYGMPFPVPTVKKNTAGQSSDVL